MRVDDVTPSGRGSRVVVVRPWVRRSPPGTSGRRAKTCLTRDRLPGAARGARAQGRRSVAGPGEAAARSRSGLGLSRSGASPAARGLRGPGPSSGPGRGHPHLGHPRAMRARGHEARQPAVRHARRRRPPRPRPHARADAHADADARAARGRAGARADARLGSRNGRARGRHVSHAWVTGKHEVASPMSPASLHGCRGRPHAPSAAAAFTSGRDSHKRV